LRQRPQQRQPLLRQHPQRALRARHLLDAAPAEAEPAAAVARLAAVVAELVVAAAVANLQQPRQQRSTRPKTHFSLGVVTAFTR